MSWANRCFACAGANGFVRRAVVRMLCVAFGSGLVTAVTASSVRVAWYPVPDTNILGYNLYYGRSNLNERLVATTTESTIALTNLGAGSIYYFYATAFNEGAESDPSNLITYTTPPPVITISWDAAQASNLAAYHFYYRNVNSTNPWQRIDTGIQTNAVLTGFWPNQSLQFYLEAVNTQQQLCELYEDKFLTVPALDIVTSQMHSIKARVAFVDSSHAGDWQPTFGADGFSLAADGNRWPSGWGLTAVADAAVSIWQNPSFNTLALKSTIQPWRVAATWLSTQNSYHINLPFTDGQVHQVAVYCLDFQNRGIPQLLEVLDTNNQQVTKYSLTNFANGIYVAFDVKGSTSLRLTGTGTSPLASGVFLDHATPSAP